MSTGLQNHALVIGINQYSDGISALKSAVRDAQALADILRAQHEYEVTCLVDEHADGDAITTFLAETLPPLLTGECAFLLYFAGHGVAQGDGNDGPQGYLLPYDAKRVDVDSWLSMGVLRQLLESLPCRHLLVVLDCCFAGAFRWASTREGFLESQPLYESQFQRYLQGDAWQALTSAAADQRAADVMPGGNNSRDAIDAGGHSPFADALIRGLSGAADSSRAGQAPDGVITATELHQFLFEELTPQDGEFKQTPGIWPLKPSNRGEYVFLNPQAAVNTIPDPPLDDTNNPWRGLKDYSPKHAGLFFGRQRVVDALVERLLDDTAPSLIVVVGASGTGKSSVVKAGLLPLLDAPPEDLQDRLGKWKVVQAPRLAADPVKLLDKAIADSAPMDGTEQQLILIDQFEELYTQCPSQQARTRFLSRLKQLLADNAGLKIILTMRSDFEPRLAGSEWPGEMLASARFLIPAFNVEETRQIIEGPASVKALYFDPAELVDQLLEEVAAMPGALPLLSFALAEMYRNALLRRREQGAGDRALTQEDYLATGGVVGAVHKRATMLFNQSDVESQKTIKRIFLRLLSQDGARLTRRRVHLSELHFANKQEQTRVDEVLKRYVDARLLMVDGEFLEPAHDTLIVAWELLQDWLAESGPQQLNRSLWNDASDWSVNKKEKGFLWDGDPRLPLANELSAELNEVEQSFLSASTKRKRTRRQLLFGSTSFVIVALSFATWYSFERANEAARQTGIAEQQLQEARFANGKVLLEVARQQLADQDYFSASLMAAKALGFQGYSSEVAESVVPEFPALINADKTEHSDLVEVLASAVMASYRPLAWRAMGLVTFAQKSHVLAGVTSRQTIEVWHLDSSKHIELDIPGSAEITALDLSPDGKMLAAVTASGDQVLLWSTIENSGQQTPDVLSAPDSELRQEFAAERAQVSAQLDIDLSQGDLFTVVFSPDGNQLAVGGRTGAIIWNLDTANLSLSSLEVEVEYTENLQSLAFLADGKSLALGGWHNHITKVGIDGGRAEAATKTSIGPAWGWDRWSEHVQKGDHVTELAIDPEEQFLVVVSANQVLVGKANENGFDFDQSGPVYETRRRIEDMALSHDGRHVAIVSEDGAVILAMPSLNKIAEMQPLTLPSSSTSSLSFNLDSTMLAWSAGGQMELRDTTMLRADGFELFEEEFAQEMRQASFGVSSTKAFVEAGKIDLATVADSLKVPKHDSELVVNERDTDLSVTYIDTQQNQHSLSLSLQPVDDGLFAAGVDRFSGAHDRSRVEVYQSTTGERVMYMMLPESDWGLDQLFFTNDGSALLVGFSNFDGYFGHAYKWPVSFPDLLIYEKPGTCHAPVNIPVDSILETPGLLVCP